MSVEGHFYVIQTLPEAAPNWLKLGFTINLAKRLKQHRTTCPTARVIRSWRCLSRWEREAMEAMTAKHCEKIGVEVFSCSDLSYLLAQGDTFFAAKDVVATATKEEIARWKVAPENQQKPKEARGVYLPYLRAWRRAKDFSLAELASRAGTGAATLSHIENGKIARFETLEKLAKALNLTREQLLHQRP